jgi:hypothetical protein
MVALVPTAQKTFSGRAPLIRVIFVFKDERKDELAWKIKMSEAEPSRTRSEDKVNGAPASQYTPAFRVLPPNSFPMLAGGHVAALAAL